MDVLGAIRQRRSIKAFTARVVTRAEIEPLLEAALLAPNHRMTQPVRFRVLGAAARRAYGAVLGARKAKKVEDPVAAQAVIDKVANSEAAVPATIVVSMVVDDNPEIREEDYATAMMGVENLLLAAVAAGLGTHLKSGAVMEDPRLREALDIPTGERVVAIVHLGEPTAAPEAKPRKPVADVTSWLD